MNTLKSISDHKIGYGMALANGQGWHITGTEGAMPWVEKLASIMELRTYPRKGCAKLIFIRGEKDREGWGEPICSLKPSIQENLPSHVWKARNFRAMQIWSHREVPDVICDIGREQSHEMDIMRMSLSLYPIFQRAQYSGGLPFHAALVERNGMGILLVGSADEGKSTCCRRLPGPWQPICDDETLVVRDDQKHYLVHPFPTWSDYLMKRSMRTWNVQRHFPLSAIFFLEQAETDEVDPIGEGQAAVFISRSASEVCYRGWIYLDHDEVRVLRKTLFENACELARAVPAFILRASLNGRFWEEMEKVL